MFHCCDARSRRDSNQPRCSTLFCWSMLNHFSTVHYIIFSTEVSHEIFQVGAPAVALPRKPSPFSVTALVARIDSQAWEQKRASPIALATRINKGTKHNVLLSLTHLIFVRDKTCKNTWLFSPNDRDVQIFSKKNSRKCWTAKVTGAARAK